MVYAIVVDLRSDFEIIYDEHWKNTLSLHNFDTFVEVLDATIF